MQTATTAQSASSQRSVTVPILSVVVPVYNEVETLPHMHERLTQVLQQMGFPYEIILVNDGSKDGSLHLMTEMSARDTHVKVVDFSRNFGHQAAITAGMAQSIGSAVVIIDADLQDPPEVIPQMMDQWRAGAEIVYAQRIERRGETIFKLLTANIFYRLLRRITAVDIPRNTGDFRLLDRRAVNAINALPERHRFMRGLAAWVGFRQVAVQYKRQERFAGTTKYPLSKMIRFALEAITGFSYFPLQLATTFGFISAALSLVGIVVAILLRVVWHEIVGEATTLILVLFLGGIQLIFLGVLGEYLGRIYDEVRARPLYIVRNVIGQTPTEEQ